MVSCSIMTGLLRAEDFHEAIISAGVGEEEEEECRVMGAGRMEGRVAHVRGVSVRNGHAHFGRNADAVRTRRDINDLLFWIELEWKGHVRREATEEGGKKVTLRLLRSYWLDGTSVRSPWAGLSLGFARVETETDSKLPVFM